MLISISMLRKIHSNVIFIQNRSVRDYWYLSIFVLPSVIYYAKVIIV
jgi:hypothetical protein